MKAAVDQDGQLFGNVRDLGTKRPVMLMHNDSDPMQQVPEADRPVMAELVAMVRGWDSTFRARSTNDWYDLTLARTDHGHFSDLTLFFPRIRPSSTRAGLTRSSMPTRWPSSTGTFAARKASCSRGLRLGTRR